MSASYLYLLLDIDSENRFRTKLDIKGDNGNHDRNHKLWNIVSTEGCILHIMCPSGTTCIFRMLIQSASTKNFN